MSRFTLLAVTFSALTLGLAYEAVRFSINGVAAVIGIGMPRVLFPGLMSLGLAALAFNLAWLMLRLARQQVTLSRLTSQQHRRLPDAPGDSDT
jgi:hypothetical protein